MPAKALVFGITLIMLVAILIFMIEIFLPLSAKIELDAICRRTILQMEIEGGLTDSMKGELLTTLNYKGFTNLAVQGTANAKYGEELSLRVTGDFTYSTLINLFTRENFIREVEYDKITISRKVIN